MCGSVSAYVCLCVCVYAKAPNALAVDLNVSAIFVHLSITNQFHTIAHLTYWRRPRLVLSSSCPSTLCAGGSGARAEPDQLCVQCNALPDYTINATCIQIGAFQLPSACLPVSLTLASLPLCVRVCVCLLPQLSVRYRYIYACTR